MNGSNFQIEQQCPQCGAPIILDETDRILSCKFCRTHVYLATDDHFRYYIPPAQGISEKIYFIPYWRLKGLSYVIKANDISYKYFDASFISFDSPLLPHSLGLRPQALKLKFVGNADNEGKFIASSDKTKENILKNYKTQADALREIFIGETASVIYTPVYCASGRVYDAVLKEPLNLQKKEAELEQALLAAPDEKWHVDFHPLLCPNCGADLPGEKDALILLCSNCHCAWDPSNKIFTPVKFSTWQEKGDNITYLPFWRLKVKISDIQLETYADLIKLANLPRAPSEVWEKTPFYFSAPAFKLNPALFLRWCRQLTVAPPPTDLTADFQGKNIHQVTLPVSEALDSAIVTLSGLTGNKADLVDSALASNFTLEDLPLDPLPFKISARETSHEKFGFRVKSSLVVLDGINPQKRNISDLISSLDFTLEDYGLVFHPFKLSCGEMIHTKLGFSLNVSSLNKGASL